MVAACAATCWHVAAGAHTPEGLAAAGCEGSKEVPRLACVMFRAGGLGVRLCACMSAAGVMVLRLRDRWAFPSPVLLLSACRVIICDNDLCLLCCGALWCCSVLFETCARTWCETDRSVSAT